MIHIVIIFKYKKKGAPGLIPTMHVPYYDPNLNMLSMVIFFMEVLFLVVGILANVSCAAVWRQG